MRSLKFKNVEDNIHKMLSILNNDEILIRYIKYLSDSPQEIEFINDNNETISQPDIPLPYSLVDNGDALLTMFKPKIATEKQVHLFFYHLRSKFHDNKNGVSDSIYRIDITLPYEFVVIKNEGKLRQERISNEICECLDNQIIGQCRVYCTEGSEFIDDQEYGYQGMSLFLKLTNAIKTL